MKRNDYKNMLDKIRCSDDFKIKMEESLSAERTEFHEYSDTVSDVEIAPKFRIKRAAIGVAACLVLCGAVGGLYHTLSKAPIGEEVGSSLEDTVLPFGDITKMEVCTTYWKGEILGEEKVNQISDYLCTLDWNTAYSEETRADGANFDLYWKDGDDNIVVTFYANGVVDWYLNSAGEVGKHNYYNFSVSTFDAVQGIILTGSYDEETFTQMTNPLALIEEHFNEANMVNEQMVGIFMEDDGQYTPSLTFTFNGEELKNILLTTKWEKAELESNENFYENFYIINGLMINQDGYMVIDSSPENLYAPIGFDAESVKRITDYLKAAFDESILTIEGNVTEIYTKTVNINCEEYGDVVVVIDGLYNQMELAETLEVGDKVRVYADNEILETYPVQLKSVYDVAVIESSEKTTDATKAHIDENV